MAAALAGSRGPHRDSRPVSALTAASALAPPLLPIQPMEESSSSPGPAPPPPPANGSGERSAHAPAEALREARPRPGRRGASGDALVGFGVLLPPWPGCEALTAGVITGTARREAGAPCGTSPEAGSRRRDGRKELSGRAVAERTVF